MKVPRKAKSYGQLDESLSGLSITSPSYDDVSRASSSDGAKSFATAATALAIGPDGQVVVQSHRLYSTHKSKPSAQGQPATVREDKRGTASFNTSRSTMKRSRRPTAGAVITWQRNPTKTGGIETASTSNTGDDKQERNKTSDSLSKKPKRSQAGEERRRRRKEIILGWQRHPRANEAKTIGVISMQEKPATKVSESKEAENAQHYKSTADKKKSEEEGSTRRRTHKNPATIGTPRKKHPSDLKKREELNPKDLVQSGALSAGTPPALSSRKASHLRVYNGNMERQRSRSRGARRRITRNREEVDFQWKREPTSKDTSIEEKGPDTTVDKSALSEAAKRLEMQRNYEEDKREAIGKLRGRRYRSGGPISKAEVSPRRGAGSRSPGPMRREKSMDRVDDCGEEQLLQLKDPAQDSTRSSSQSRRRQSRSLSGGSLKGIDSSELNCRRRLSRTHSGDKVNLVGEEQGTRSRRHNSARSLSLEKDRVTTVDH